MLIQTPKRFHQHAEFFFKKVHGLFSGYLLPVRPIPSSLFQDFLQLIQKRISFQPAGYDLPSGSSRKLFGIHFTAYVFATSEFQSLKSQT